MRYHRLGSTGLFVSELCLGTMTFGDKGYWQVMGSLDQSHARSLVETALEAGVNFIDTADVYAEGESERILGHILKDLTVKRSDLVIASKTYGRVGPGPNDIGASRGHIMDSIQRTLERTQLDYIDLYQIHAFDPLTPIEETLRALDDLTRQGLIRYVGVSNWAAWQVMKACGLADKRGYSPLVSVQAYYSIAGRDLERELVPMAQDQGLGLLIWSPLAGGYLADKRTTDGKAPEGTRRATFDFPPVDLERGERCLVALRQVSAKHECSVARIALAWVLSRPFVSSLIVGARTTVQLQDNLAATSIQLDNEDLALLDAASALSPEYPGWMLTRQQRNRLPNS